MLVWQLCFLVIQAGPSAAETENARTNGSPPFPPLTESNTPPAKETLRKSSSGLDANYKLGIGDRLSFRIAEDEDEAKSLLVTDSGDIEVPYLGRVSAAGKSCQDLAHALKTELEKEYYYHATVIVAVDAMAKSRGKVYVVGAVRAPGQQDIPSDENFTLTKAILRAGGFAEFADKKNVKLTRKGGTSSKSLAINVVEILENGNSASDLKIEPGDLIYVPERLIKF